MFLKMQLSKIFFLLPLWIVQYDGNPNSMAYCHSIQYSGLGNTIVPWLGQVVKSSRNTINGWVPVHLFFVKEAERRESTGISHLLALLWGKPRVMSNFHGRIQQSN